jgi:hypothetical protein
MRRVPPRYLLIPGLVVFGFAWYYLRPKNDPGPGLNAPSATVETAAAPAPAPVHATPLREETRAARQIEELNRRQGSAQQVATPPSPATIARVGNESVPLRFINRSRRPPNPRDEFNDDGHSGGFFAPLAAKAAAGDDFAAQYLWQTIQLCRDVPSTPAERRAKLDKIKEDYALTGGHGRTLEQDLDTAEARYGRCEGINEASFVDALALLRDAADQGTNAAIQLEYAHAIAKDKPDEARQRLEALWNEGHVGALSLLANDSLSYRMASEALQIAFLDDGQHPGPLAAYRAHADRVRNETSPSEYDEAAQKAAELLRNPNCCVVP